MESENLKKRLLEAGATLVGIGDLSNLDHNLSLGMTRGISIAIALDAEIVKGIAHGPTTIYHKAYGDLNEKLDDLANLAAEWLKSAGYHAVAQTRSAVTVHPETHASRLPHKTVATKAGLGWIGRCALLVTPEYGSAVRLTSVLTDAPLTADLANDKSQCGTCHACVQACPGVAVEGVLWYPGMPREELYDAGNCRKTAKELSAKIGVEETLCGKCIEICPYTQKYLQMKP